MGHDEKREKQDPEFSFGRRLVRSGCGIGVLVLIAAPLVIAGVLRWLT